jgi:hypothetical protein
MRDEHFASATDGRLRMGMALRGPCFTTAQRNAQDFAFARDLGLPISVHVGGREPWARSPRSSNSTCLGLM